MNKLILTALALFLGTSAWAQTFNLTLEGLGAAESLLRSPGADITLKSGLTLPTGDKAAVDVQLDWSYSSFTLKTFNFPAGESLDARLVDWTTAVSAALALRLGDAKTTLQKIQLDGKYEVAQDLGDSNQAFNLGYDLTLNPDIDWRLDFKLDTGLKLFPDYLAGGNRIDSVSAAVQAAARYAFNADWALRLTAKGDIKQYLQATYDTPTVGVRSTQNRRYLTPDLQLELLASPGPVKSTTSWEGAWQISQNYDLWVTGTPANQFVTGYFDYLQQTLREKFDWSILRGWRLTSDLSWTARWFLTYPARDASQAFTGQKRLDNTYKAKLGLEWDFFKTKAQTLTALAEGWYDQDVSNNTYETSFATNHLQTGLQAGIRWTL